MEKARVSIPYPLEADTKSAGVGGPPRGRCMAVWAHRQEQKWAEGLTAIAWGRHGAW